MNLGTLELRLQQSEQASVSLTAQIKLSKTQLETLTESLAQQTKRTASLERQSRFYKTGFYITVGISVASIGALVLINVLR
jgi:F0F1-type ATP synthase delta subunit